MWWWVGIGGFVLFSMYMLLFLSVGFRTIGNGHTWMFVIGILFPVFWLIGALMRENV